MVRLVLQPCARRPYIVSMTQSRAEERPAFPRTRTSRCMHRAPNRSEGRPGQSAGQAPNRPLDSPTAPSPRSTDQSPAPEHGGNRRPLLARPRVAIRPTPSLPTLSLAADPRRPDGRSLTLLNIPARKTTPIRVQSPRIDCSDRETTSRRSSATRPTGVLQGATCRPGGATGPARSSTGVRGGRGLRGAAAGKRSSEVPVGRSRCCGPPRGERPTYRHIVIDEAQDLRPLQWGKPEARRVKRWHRARAEQGLPPTSGSRLFGYHRG
jgi:hypothetical protein